MAEEPSSASKSPGTHYPPLIATAIAASVLTLVAAEAGLRLYERVTGRDATLSVLPVSTAPAKMPNTGGNPSWGPKAAPLKLGDLLQRSDNLKILYELRPSVSGLTPDGSRHATNAAGFRGPDYPTTKPPNTVRIVGIGDSWMYGHGVNDGEEYMQLLAERLQESHEQVKWEIINTAVSGYNTVNEVETLRVKGLAYLPDVVVIHFYGNDLGLPSFVHPPEGLRLVSLWKRAFGYRFDGLLQRSESRHRRWDDELVASLPAPQYGVGEAEVR